MEPTAAPFIGQVAQWGAVGVLVAVLAFLALTLWKTWRADTATWAAKQDARDKEARDDRKEQTAADNAMAAALSSLRDVILGRAKT